MVAVVMDVGVVVLLGVAGVGLVIVLLVVVGGEEVIGICAWRISAAGQSVAVKQRS